MKKFNINESEQVEFKDCRGVKKAKLPSDLWQSIAAFANSHGGRIFLGIEDDGSILNLPTTDMDKLQKDLSTLLSNNFFNNKPKVTMCTHNGYIEVLIAESEFYNKPIYSKKLDQNKFGYAKVLPMYEPQMKKCVVYLLERLVVEKTSQ